MSTHSQKYKITAIPDYFQQSGADSDVSLYKYAENNFGLINRAYDTDAEYNKHDGGEKTQWQRFAFYVEHLRKQARGTGTDYRVLYLGRHGQGWHNVAESYYGTAEWDRYWSKLEGGPINDHNLNATWADAQLTYPGILDARAVNAFWKNALSVAKIPAPQRYYTSPLHRCCATAYISFLDLDLPKDRPFAPQVRELLRETNGEHTCDRRSTRSYIHSQFPTYTFEPSFAENDELWRPDEREQAAAQTKRLHTALEEMFVQDDGEDSATWISITNHSGSIAAILRAVGHREFGLPTGGLMPLFVKAVKI